jgi:hypothetical protein
MRYRVHGADGGYLAGLMMCRKTNVETVPVDFQKAQLLRNSARSNLRIFAALADASGTGSRSGVSQCARRLTNTLVMR